MFKASMIAVVGAVLGVVLRFFTGIVGSIFCGSDFPLDFFVASGVGYFLIGLLYGMVNNARVTSKQINMAMMVGLSIGFTAFSALTDNMMALLDRGEAGTYLWYMVVSVVIGVGVMVVGTYCVKERQVEYYHNWSEAEELSEKFV